MSGEVADADADADYIIVGAGLAGLHTGIEILKKHKGGSVTILERYGYNGGRVVTYKHKIGRAALQWENGAGRIHKEKHQLVMKYIRRYNLTLTPIRGDLEFVDSDVSRKNLFESTYVPMIENILGGLDSSILGTHTVKELLEEIVGAAKTKELLGEFAYDSEVDTLRADWALRQFRDVVVKHSGFAVCKEGLSSLIAGMVREFEGLGGEILQKHRVTGVIPTSLEVHVGDEEGSKVFKARKAIVLALHYDALCELGSLAGWAALKQVKMRPLLRTYAVFKGEPFEGLSSTVTPDGIRYFIPMSGNIAMVSYTDGTSAEKWLKILKEDGEKVLCDKILSELRLALKGSGSGSGSDKKIPEPIFFKAHPWYSGCSYWVPGDYDVIEASVAAHIPCKGSAVYVCGESFSLRQAWMEGALEHAESLLKNVDL